MRLEPEQGESPHPDNFLNYAGPAPPSLPEWAWRVSVVAVGVTTYVMTLLGLLFFAGFAALN